MRKMIKRTVSLALCIMMAAVLCGCDKLDYNEAVKLYEAGGYEGAKAAFEALGEYEDSADYAAKAGLILSYDKALKLYAEENYAEAKELFAALGEYESSAEYLKKTEDKLLAGEIVGRWLTGEVDMTDLLRGFMLEEFAAMGYENISLDNMEKLCFRAYYSFEDYGLVRQKLDEENFDRAIETMARISKNIIISFTEQEIAAVALEYGMSAEEVYAALGVSDAEEYLAINMGMSLDELLAMIYNEETMSYLMSTTEVTGAWYVKDGVLCIVSGDEVERGRYDAENDLIILTESEYSGEHTEDISDEEMKIIYPIELKRADEAKPAA